MLTHPCAEGKSIGDKLVGEAKMKGACLKVKIASISGYI
jgi:hypothetical protein